jgi:magnesium transporter
VRVLDTFNDEAERDLKDPDAFTWLDLVAPDEATLTDLGERMGWHPLVCEDLREMDQRPKLERHGHIASLFFNGVRPGPDGLPDVVEVGIVVDGSYVVTVRREPMAELDRLRNRLRDSRGEEQWVVYSILDELTDTFFPGLEAIDDRIDALERAIVEDPQEDHLREVFELKRTLVDLRRTVAPQRDLAQRALADLATVPGLDPASKDYVRDVYDHLLRVADTIDSYRDVLTSITDVYLSMTSNRLNEVLRRLTTISTIFLPLTVVTGFFGMNFAWLEGHIDSLAAFLVYGVGGVLCSGIALFLYFRKAGVFDKNPR